MRATHCLDCGILLSEDPGLPNDERSPCPECGSLGRKFKVNIQAAITPRGMTEMKARHPGGERPYVETKSGYDLYRKTGVWHQLERIIDRTRDWYYEKIVNESGQLIRMTNEPLSKHRGHGSAKRKGKK